MPDPSNTSSETPIQPVAQDPAAVAHVAAAPDGQTPAPVVSDPAAAALAAVALPTADPAAAKPTQGQAVTPTVPDTYDIKLPPGFELHPSTLPALTPTFKELGLSNDAANKLTSTFINFVNKQAVENSQADLAVMMKDPELGGLNYGRTSAHVNAALAAFTEPTFRKLLATKGLDNNLEFVRVFERIGRAMTGDTPVRGTPTGAEAMSQADRVYGRSKA